jgi:hypothetical protein
MHFFEDSKRNNLNKNDLDPNYSGSLDSLNKKVIPEKNNRKQRQDASGESDGSDGQNQDVNEDSAQADPGHDEAYGGDGMPFYLLYIFLE